MWMRITLLAALVAATAGCFEIPGEHTLYLEPDGAVTWSILEEEIRPQADDPEAAEAEREKFLKQAVAGTNDSSRALALLNPSSVQTRVLRDEEPYAVITEAHYPAIDQVYRNLLDLLHFPATVELTEEGDLVRLVVTAWPADEEESDPDEEPGDYADRLLALFMECRIVITEGKFVAASNFEILEEGAAARPTDPDEYDDETPGKPVVLSLAWTRNGK